MRFTQHRVPRGGKLDVAASIPHSRERPVLSLRVVVVAESREDQVLVADFVIHAQGEIVGVLSPYGAGCIVVEIPVRPAWGKDSEAWRRRRSSGKKE